MSIREYKELIEKENSVDSIEVLKAKKELLTTNEESKQLIAMLNGKNVNETLMILNTYLDNREESVSTSNEKGITHTLSNPNIPKFLIPNDEDNGFSNIILLSIALILLGIIISIIIFI